MVAAIACTPASPVAVKSACRFDITGLDANSADGTAHSYYIAILEGSTVKGRSYRFNTSQDGKHTFNNYHFPDNGSYTLEVRNVSGDAVQATASVTVS